MPHHRAKLSPVQWPATALPRDQEGASVPITALAVEFEAQMTWQYSSKNDRVLALYEQGKRAQWNATSDVDWSIEVDWGARLDSVSTYARIEFERSHLGCHGSGLWNAFQWEFQSWMVSQFLHGEQGALLASSRLAESLPDLEAKFYAVNQAVDEARHVEVFSRYLAEHVPEPYAVADALQSLLVGILSDSRWDIVALGMQIIVEGLAMAAFRMANSTFHDELITSITSLVISDEARHVSFGTMCLDGAYHEMSGSERRERETFVLEAAALVHRRFLLGEVWERLGVKEADGVEFAQTNPVMVSYRQTIFAKVVVALRRIGLLTPRIIAGLEGLNLIGRYGRSTMSSD